MEIVLTFSGAKKPKYLLHNLRYLKRTFPELHVVLLLDEPNYPREYDSLCKVEIVDVNSELMASLFVDLKHDPNFWNGFWYRTISRFFLIEAYMTTNPDAPVLHVEGDVLLLPNFPFDSFVSIKDDLAFPMINPNQGVASIFFIRKLSALQKFLLFSAKAVESSPFETDMSLLAKYAKDCNEVLILPSLIKSNFEKSPTDEFRKKSTLGFGDFLGLFDGATYGQYLFGLDPRNNLGKRTLFETFPSHFANPNAIEFSLETYQATRNLYLSSGNSLRVPLYCLHIHSKDIRAFIPYTSPSSDLLSKRVSESKSRRVKVEIVVHFYFSEFIPFTRAIFHILRKKLKGLFGK